MAPSAPKLQVIYEDNHLLVVNKPAGVVSQGALPDAPSLLHQATEYIRAKYQKPGNVYLGVVSRLDKSVSGVTVLARTSKAAARLSEQFRERQVDKTYWAVVSGLHVDCTKMADVNLKNWLLQRDDSETVKVVSPTTAGAKEASLAFRPILDLGQGLHLLSVRLHTGRKHQIRVQLAHAGYPIVGDRKYGSPLSFENGIMLHAVSLSVYHPTQKDQASQQPLQLEFKAPLPSSWLRRCSALQQLIQ